MLRLLILSLNGKTEYMIVANFLGKSLFTLYVGAILISLSSHAKPANFDSPDHAAVPEWQIIKDLMFGDRPIFEGRGKIVSMFLNTKLDDASTVPVMINGDGDQTRDSYIKTLYVVIDKNPIPTAGIFHFSPESGRVKLETRLRFEKYSFVRAIAEMNDGSLFMDQQWVQVQGGCSAPSGRDAADDPLLGKMRFRFDDAFAINEPNLVQVQIRHPNESALAVDLDPNHEAQFLNSLDVQYNGESVISAEINFSISDNPVFKFYFFPRSEGELTVRAKDTHDSVFSESIQLVKDHSN